MPGNPKLNAVLEYLRGEFPDFSIVDYLDGAGRFTYQLLKGDQTHFITVLADFLVHKDVEQINRSMENYRVASVLRNVGDFRVLVTNSGCIFA